MVQESQHASCRRVDGGQWGSNSNRGSPSPVGVVDVLNLATDGGREDLGSLNTRG